MIQTTPWARSLVAPASLAVIHREAVEREAHVSLSATSPHGPLLAVVYATMQGPQGGTETVEWLRTQGPVEHVVQRIHETLATPPELALGYGCRECGEATEPGYDLCDGCCGHENVETRDEADGHEGGLPHEWVSRCEDCGAVLEWDGEGWRSL